MENDKDSAVSSNGGPGLNLTDQQVSRTVVISNIPAKTEASKLYIHFQRKGNGGGEIENLEMLDDGRAILTYDEAKVAESVLHNKHEFGGTLLQLEPYKKTAEVKKQMEVFSLVSAKINPAVFNMATEELIQTLTNIKEKTETNFIELCDGIWVSGTYKQIETTCSMLSTIATPREARENAHTDLECTLDVQPKLMSILRRKIQEIQDKYEMKIENSSNGDKAVLSPVGKEELFEEGKEEFINLYQKAFQEMDEKRFELDIDNSAAEKTFKELMDEFNVVIDRKDKEICIYGRNNDVGKAMQHLQGKPRRSRKSFKADSNDELMKPDTYAQLPQNLKYILENGVTVSVYQGDITQQHVDVIVNAANERLEHGGGVAGAIIKHGGYQIQHESRQLVQQYGLVPVGQVAHTGPGYLPCKRIFHAIGPQWSVHGPEGSRQLIYHACCNSFALASQFGSGSIALPGISSGIYGVPKEVCAEMMFTAAEYFSLETSPQNQLRDIRFVNIDSLTNEAFRHEFHKRYIENRSSGITNGPHDRKDSRSDVLTRDKNGPFVNGSQTNRGTQVPAGNPSDDLERGKKPDKPGSYAAAAAMKRWEANQPKAGDSKPPLQDKVSTGVQSSERSFQQGYTERVQENKKPQTPAVDNPSKLVSKEETNKKTDSKVAAMKRVEASHSKVESNASVRGKPIADQQSSGKSFKHGYNNRQQNTSRDNTETINDNLIDQENQINKDTTDAAESQNLVKAPQTNKTDTNLIGDKEKKQVGSPPKVPGNDQPGHTDTTSTSIPVDGPGKGAGRGKARNGKRSNEEKQKTTGRGRGAIAARLQGATPGTAVREQASNLNNSSNSTVTPGREVKRPPGFVPEQPAGHTVDPQNLQFPDNSQEHLQAHPPGLKVSKEGLKLAATCEVENGVVESSMTTSLSSEETSRAKASTSNKRKTDQEEPLRSPKLRKEDEHDHDTVVEEDGKKEREQEDKKDGDSGNKISNQVTRENDKEVRKEEDVELQDNLNALSEKEKGSTADKSTTEEDETGAVKSRENVPIETIEKSAVSLEIGAKKNNTEELEKDRVHDKLENKTDQKDEAKNKDGGNYGDHEDDERQNGDEDYEGSTDKTSVNEEDKDIVGDKDIEVTQSPEKIHIDPETQDKAQQDDETAMNSYVVLSSEGEQQTCRERQQGHKRVSEDSSSSESIEFVDAVDQDLSPFHDASYLDSQSDLDQSSEKNITEENSSEGDTPSVSKCRAGKEQPAASDENEEVKKQGVEDTSGGHTQAPLVDQSDQEGQTSTKDNDTNASRNIRSGATETSSPQDQSPQSKDETSTEENSEYREDGTKRVDDAQSEDKQDGIERVDDLQSSNTNSQTDPETKHKQDGTERLDDPQSSLTSQSNDLVQALGALSLSNKSEDSSEKESTEPLPLDQQKECSLCKTAFSSDRPEVILSGCGHVVCKDCKSTQYKETQNVICPSCEKTAGCNVLQPPGGQMKHGILEQSLEGHSDHKTIYIDYHFPAGIQGSCHPKPGSPYDESDRRTFLPFTEEGRKVLELFDKAFKAGLLFTIGKCTISDPHKENQIVFCGNEVEHKINFKGGPSCHGYPDPEYLVRVTEQLRDIGIE